MTSSEPARLDSTPHDIGALVSSASVEVSSRGHDIELLRDGFAPGTEVTITFLPGDDYHHNIETATRLRQLGYTPVPHVAARGLPSREALDDFLTRVRGEADVSHILLIAGDIAVPRGPFASTLDACLSGVIEGHGIKRVTIAGHPEGHPHVDADEAFAAIAARLEWASGAGIELGMITQFCFQSEPILALMRALEARGARLPVRVGLAGPATPATLMKFALRCGIGASIKALRGSIGRFGRLLVDAGPDEVVHGIADAPADRRALLEGFHVYPLGGVRKANKWVQSAARGEPPRGSADERRR